MFIVPLTTMKIPQPTDPTQEPTEPTGTGACYHYRPLYPPAPWMGSKVTLWILIQKPIQLIMIQWLMNPWRDQLPPWHLQTPFVVVQISCLLVFKFLKDGGVFYIICTFACDRLAWFVFLVFRGCEFCLTFLLTTYQFIEGLGYDLYTVASALMHAVSFPFLSASMHLIPS